MKHTRKASAGKEVSAIYLKLKEHYGHKVEIVGYGSTPDNLAIECVDCCSVIIDSDKFVDESL